MHDGMPYGRIQGQGQGHSREVDRQSPTGLILYTVIQKHRSHWATCISAIIFSFSRPILMFFSLLQPEMISAHT